MAEVVGGAEGSDGRGVGWWPSLAATLKANSGKDKNPKGRKMLRSIEKAFGPPTRDRF